MTQKVIHQDDICTVVQVDFNHYRVFESDGNEQICTVNYQNGSPITNGKNGMTMESNLAIMIARLEGINVGQFKCINNDVALDGMKAALAALTSRIYDRKKRGVHDTNKE